MCPLLQTETIPLRLTMSSGTSLSVPASGLLAPPPPLHTKTGRKPQRSSPLAGPAVSVTDSEDSLSRLRVSSSPSLYLDAHSLSPLTSPKRVSAGSSRPKSLYSSLSFNPHSLHPQDCPALPPGTKQLTRPASSIFPLTATQVHFSDSTSSGSQATKQHRDRGERRLSKYGNHAVPSRKLEPPIIMLNEEAIDVAQTTIPPLVRSASRTTESTSPRDNSWYITNAYEETPRFSRLSLAAGSVVMPVSAKEYKKGQRRSVYPSGNGHSPSVNSGGNIATKPTSGNRRTLFMASLASTLNLTGPNARTSPDYQEPPSLTHSFSQPSLSSRASNSFPDSDSSPASSTTSSLFPGSNLSRTRTNSFTDSSSTHTFVVPEIVTSSSKTSISEEIAQEPSPTVIHGMETPQVPTVKRVFLSSKINRRTVALGSLPPLNQETTRVKAAISAPVVERNEKMRRGGTLKRIIRFFVSS